MTKLWMLAAIIICGATVLTSCVDTTDNPVTDEKDDFCNAGTLVKADAETAADIEEKLQTGNVNTNLPGSDALNIDHTSGSGWGR